MIENAGNTLSRLTILENIWGYIPERYTDTRLIDVYISKLRLKIEENSRNPDLILTVRGVGYMFQSIIRPSEESIDQKSMINAVEL